MKPQTVLCSCPDCSFEWESREYIDRISGPELEHPDCPRCEGLLVDEPDTDRDELHVARLVRGDGDVDIRPEDFDRTPAHLYAGIEKPF